MKSKCGKHYLLLAIVYSIFLFSLYRWNDVFPPEQTKTFERKVVEDDISVDVSQTRNGKHLVDMLTVCYRQQYYINNMFDSTFLMGCMIRTFAFSVWLHLFYFFLFGQKCEQSFESFDLIQCNVLLYFGRSLFCSPKWRKHIRCSALVINITMSNVIFLRFRHVSQFESVKVSLCNGFYAVIFLPWSSYAFVFCHSIAFFSPATHRHIYSVAVAL